MTADTMLVDLTVARLREVLDYAPQTGVFLWLQQNKWWTGKIAGALDAQGYRLIGVNGRKYRASRLAWFYVYGEWPPHNIDHIDRNRLNDRIVNLRLATQSQNNANTGIPRHNTSGVKGVHKCNATGRWRASIQIDGKCLNLGRYTRKIDAVVARQRAEKKYFGKFAGS